MLGGTENAGAYDETEIALAPGPLNREVKQVKYR